MNPLEQLANKMIEYYSHDPLRTQHFIKVHAFSRLIGMGEGLTGDELLTLEAAAYVHDIGIRAAEEQFGKSNGKLQEELGPDLAYKMLTTIGFDENITQRVCYLVGHHHTYTNIDGPDYQILVEADFLVNLFEDSSSSETIANAFHKIFKTKTGSFYCQTMFDC